MKIRLLAVLALFLTSTAVGQTDFGAQLRQMAKVNAEKYVSPLVNGWGAALNSGFYHTADVHGILGFDVHIKFTGSLLQDADKKYQFTTPDFPGYVRDGTGPNGYPGEVEANTVAGENKTIPVVTNGGTTLMTIPAGFNLPTTPLLIPQVSIGLPFGFEVTGRFFPTAKVGDLGKINMLGFGLRHDVDQYIPMLPLDVAVHFMTQSISYEDNQGTKLFEASGTAFGIEASKHLILFTVYAGFQIESSSMTIGPYTATVAGQPVTIDAFELEGANSSRVLLGARMSLLFLNLHADYNIGTTKAFALGVGISFR
ncbi:MAG TPA: DUF6588 family protein [Bacteroidota bacterium]